MCGWYDQQKRNDDLANDHGSLREQEMQVAEYATTCQQHVNQQADHDRWNRLQTLQNGIQWTSTAKTRVRKNEGKEKPERCGDQDCTQRHTEGYTDNVPERRVTCNEQIQSMRCGFAQAFQDSSRPR